MEFAKDKRLDSLQLGRCMDTKATEGEVDKSHGGRQGAEHRPDADALHQRPPHPGQHRLAQHETFIDYEIEYQKTANNAGENCCEVKIPSALNK